MALPLHVVLAIVLLGIAAYAQHRIPFHTRGRGSVVLTRTLLAVTGVGMGAVAAAMAPDWPTAIVAFLEGFGVVHVPAAVILFLKRARQEGGGERVRSSERNP